MTITIQTFFGIGDALFVVPTLQRIKEAYPKAHIAINTRWPVLFEKNPYVDEIGSTKHGLKLMYTDPVAHQRTGRLPTCHNIRQDWELICKAFGLNLEEPELRPQVYFDFETDALRCKYHIGVQTSHKGLYFNKKDWYGFKELAQRERFTPIPWYEPREGGEELRELATFLTGCSAVVAAEGGVAHLCRALNVPCVVVYGGFSLPTWNGYMEHANITCGTSCAPCFDNRPCAMPNKNGEPSCMAAILVDAVQRVAFWMADGS